MDKIALFNDAANLHKFSRLVLLIKGENLQAYVSQECSERTDVDEVTHDLLNLANILRGENYVGKDFADIIRAGAELLGVDDKAVVEAALSIA